MSQTSGAENVKAKTRLRWKPSTLTRASESLPVLDSSNANSPKPLAKSLPHNKSTTALSFKPRSQGKRGGAPPTNQHANTYSDAVLQLEDAMQLPAILRPQQSLASSPTIKKLHQVSKLQNEARERAILASTDRNSQPETRTNVFSTVMETMKTEPMRRPRIALEGLKPLMERSQSTPGFSSLEDLETRLEILSYTKPLPREWPERRRGSTGSHRTLRRTSVDLEEVHRTVVGSKYRGNSGSIEDTVPVEYQMKFGSHTANDGSDTARSDLSGTWKYDQDLGFVLLTANGEISNRYVQHHEGDAMKQGMLMKLRDLKEQTLAGTLVRYPSRGGSGHGMRGALPPKPNKEQTTTAAAAVPAKERHGSVSSAGNGSARSTTSASAPRSTRSVSPSSYGTRTTGRRTAKSMARKKDVIVKIPFREVPLPRQPGSETFLSDVARDAHLFKDSIVSARQEEDWGSSPQGRGVSPSSALTGNGTLHSARYSFSDDGRRHPLDDFPSDLKQVGLGPFRSPPPCLFHCFHSLFVVAAVLTSRNAEPAATVAAVQCHRLHPAR